MGMKSIDKMLWFLTHAPIATIGDPIGLDRESTIDFCDNLPRSWTQLDRLRKAALVRTSNEFHREHPVCLDGRLGED